MNVYDNSPLMICVTGCIYPCVFAAIDDDDTPIFASINAMWVSDNGKPREKKRQGYHKTG
jgi:hypothetical protein